jgi:hypothetical protein
VCSEEKDEVEDLEEERERRAKQVVWCGAQFVLSGGPTTNGVARSMNINIAFLDRDQDSFGLLLFFYFILYSIPATGKTSRIPLIPINISPPSPTSPDQPPNSPQTTVQPPQSNPGKDNLDMWSLKLVDLEIKGLKTSNFKPCVL